MGASNLGGALSQLILKYMSTDHKINRQKEKRMRIFGPRMTSMLLVFALGLAGCQAGAIGDSPETATPTGCHKKFGRYYDPKLGQCIDVNRQDAEQILLLDAYRYVHELAEKGELSEVEYRIHLRTFMPVEEAEVLWSELRSQGAKMRSLAGAMPDGKTYDPLPGDERRNPETYIWTDNGQGCGWHWAYNPDSTANATLYDLMLEDLNNAETGGWERPRPELRKGIFEDKECRIYYMGVTAKPAVMRDFWDRHLDKVGGIMPQVTFMDEGMHNLITPQPLKEE